MTDITMLHARAADSDKNANNLKLDALMSHIATLFVTLSSLEQQSTFGFRHRAGAPHAKKRKIDGIEKWVRGGKSTEIQFQLRQISHQLVCYNNFKNLIGPKL